MKLLLGSGYHRHGIGLIAQRLLVAWTKKPEEAGWVLTIMGWPLPYLIAQAP
jgi:hypothetical protein